ncbi:hypothetical protein K1719_034898 [Acacia pycnantha]|nr:hypothetical protein K1719_034898 [Acacia pycnantha]
MVLLLNKCDLIPAWATKGWLRVLSREYPTLAFHASINKSFGKELVVLKREGTTVIEEFLSIVLTSFLDDQRLSFFEEVVVLSFETEGMPESFGNSGASVVKFFLTSVEGLTEEV